MESLSDTDARLDKNKDWQKAVTEELKILDDQQGALDNKYSELATEQDNLSTLCQQCTNSCATNHENILKLHKAMKKMQEQFSQMEDKIALLEKENDQFIDREVEMRRLNNELRDELDTLKNASRLSCTSMQETPRSVKLQLPKFKGAENDRPMKFLSALKKYVQATKPDITNLQCLISQALEEAAKDWWYLVESKVDSLSDFETLFKTRFWNSSMQRNARRRIELGQYNPQGKYTRVQYATYILGLASELDVDYSEEDLAQRLIEHFEKEVRHALLGRDVTNNEVLFKILSDFDFDKERVVKPPFQRNASSNAPSTASQRPPHINVRNVEVANTPEVKKTSKQKSNNNSQPNKKAIADATAELDVLNIELNTDPCINACLTPGNGK